MYGTATIGQNKRRNYEWVKRKPNTIQREIEKKNNNNNSGGGSRIRGSGRGSDYNIKSNHANWIRTRKIADHNTIWGKFLVKRIFCLSAPLVCLSLCEYIKSISSYYITVRFYQFFLLLLLLFLLDRIMVVSRCVVYFNLRNSTGPRKLNDIWNHMPLIRI